MAALSADRNTLYADPRIEAYPVATDTTIYKGSLVMINSSGYAIPGADTASCVFVGVAQEQVVVASGADNGSKYVKVARLGCYRFAYGGTAAITDVGTMAYLVDDQTVNVAGSTSNDIPCGKITQVNTTANEVWLDIGLAWV